LCFILINYARSLPRRHRLQKLFSAFPAGWPGIGLICLRFAVAISAIAQGLSTVATPSDAALSMSIEGTIAILLGVALLIGVCTPVAGFAATIGYLLMSTSLLLATDAYSRCCGFRDLDLAAISVALTLLGPGAFSLDARLFGRREIIIPEGRRPPR
jgi:uncharacterized membrane protein YphA (DoxX/SURF4 family)